MKPGLSLARIGVRPIRRPTSVVAASAASRGRSAVATTSTSFISAGGLKKCMPTTRSGSGTSAAIVGHRQRGGVAGEDRLRAAGRRPARRTARASAPGPRAPPRSPGRSRRARRGSAAAPTRPPAASASSSLQQPLRGALRQRLAQPLAPRLQRRRDRVVQPRLVAAEAGDLGDPGAHRAGADDADPARRVTGPRTSARASRGRPACPRPGPRSPSPARRGGARSRGRRESAVSSAASTACLARRAAIGGRSATVARQLQRLLSQSPLLDDLVDQAQLAAPRRRRSGARSARTPSPAACRSRGPGAGCRRRRG